MTPRGVEIGVERAGQRQRLDQPVIETARHIAHQRTQPPAMLDQPAQILPRARAAGRSEEHTSELQSLMRTSYAVFCLKKKRHITTTTKRHHQTELLYTV